MINITKITYIQRYSFQAFIYRFITIFFLLHYNYDFPPFASVFALLALHAHLFFIRYVFIFFCSFLYLILPFLSFPLSHSPSSYLLALFLLLPRPSLTPSLLSFPSPVPGPPSPLPAAWHDPAVSSRGSEGPHFPRH